MELQLLDDDDLDCGGTSQIPKDPNYDGSSYNNPVSGPRLQIHPEVIGTDADVEERFNTNDDSNHDIEDFSNPGLNEVMGDIDDKSPAHMLSVDLDAMHAPDFSDITLVHRLASNSQLEELFVGQQFKNKVDCVFSIKQYIMNVSIDYKVTKSTSTLYVGECWTAEEWCNWRF
ncbi:hypothetical protein J1N35_026257 [Gossypium stocksii]|uniref:Transposase MuDR plant domain-containing protein n=1 Tax=Gossypium stocksii TaxID=47602 RepID=A0A9D3V869_9ROSI|nr:hypothetical protein J1N35_026257 [Gossypium stocksii]